MCIAVSFRGSIVTIEKRYNLGPNGGILTALNLFTTKFDQVLELVEKRAETVECVLFCFLQTDDDAAVDSHVILDTPGQIEIFTWSASGAIITDAVASSFPTVVAYIIDTPRTTAPATFMSNMLYACRFVVSFFFCLRFSMDWPYHFPRFSGQYPVQDEIAVCARV